MDVEAASREVVNLAEYVQRFPRWEQELRMLWEVDREAPVMSDELGYSVDEPTPFPGWYVGAASPAGRIRLGTDSSGSSAAGGWRGVPRRTGGWAAAPRRPEGPQAAPGAGPELDQKPRDASSNVFFVRCPSSRSGLTIPAFAGLWMSGDATGCRISRCRSTREARSPRNCMHVAPSRKPTPRLVADVAPCHAARARFGPDPPRP